MNTTNKKDFSIGDKAVKNNMRNSTNEGVLNSASSAITDSYTVPYALYLGASNAEVGILSALMNIAAIVSQTPGVWLTRQLGRKRVWYISNFFGKIFWLPIVLLPFFLKNGIIVWTFIIIMSCMWFINTMRRPAWTSLMGDVIPSERRSSYFGTRNALLGISALGTIIVVGFLLPKTGFELIFIAAVSLAMLSFLFFSRMTEPPMKKPFYYKHTFSIDIRDSVKFFRINMNFTKFSFYVTFAYFGVEIAAPFTAVYILKNLGISYELFALSIALGMLARIVAHKYWGIIAEKYGTKNMLLVTGILICFIPFGYLLSTNFYHIAIVKIYDGFAYAGFELAIFNFLLGVTPSDDRPRFIANHNIMAGMGIVLGDIVGILIVSHPMWILIGIQAVFLASFIFRLISVFILRTVKDVEKKPTNTFHVFWNAVAVQPFRNVKNIVFFAENYPYNLGAVRRKIVKEREHDNEWYTHW